MVKVKSLVVALLVLGVGIFAFFYFSPGEERKVKKQFRSLSEYVAKASEENALTVAAKAKKIGALFADPSEIKALGHFLSGRHSREEITGHALRGRSYFVKLSLTFYDVEVTFPEREIAKVHVTARLEGRSTFNENVDEVREMECVLRKVDGQWLFSDLEVIEVLKK